MVAIVVVSILLTILERIAIMRILNDAILQEQNVITTSF